LLNRMLPNQVLEAAERTLGIIEGH
jgi:hypothetical protein